MAAYPWEYSPAEPPGWTKITTPTRKSRSSGAPRGGNTGCRILFSENLQPARQVAGITIVNPFR